MTHQPGDPVLVRYLKYPATLHWRHPMWFLGEDEYGQWLGAPENSVIQRGSEEPVVWAQPFVQLIPFDGWWTLLGNARTSHFALYVDIITQPVWNGDVVEMVDVDLDVVRTWEGETRLLDEDEFLEHQRTLAYPQSLIDGARAAAAKVVLAVEAYREPFGNHHLTWLEQAVSSPPRSIAEYPISRDGRSA